MIDAAILLVLFALMFVSGMLLKTRVIDWVCGIPLEVRTEINALKAKAMSNIKGN